MPLMDIGAWVIQAAPIIKHVPNIIVIIPLQNSKTSINITKQLQVDLRVNEIIFISAEGK